MAAQVDIKKWCVLDGDGRFVRGNKASNFIREILFPLTKSNRKTHDYTNSKRSLCKQGPVNLVYIERSCNAQNIPLEYIVKDNEAVPGVSRYLISEFLEGKKLPNEAAIEALARDHGLMKDTFTAFVNAGVEYVTECRVQSTPEPVEAQPNATHSAKEKTGVNVPPKGQRTTPHSRESGRT